MRYYAITGTTIIKTPSYLRQKYSLNSISSAQSQTHTKTSQTHTTTPSSSHVPPRNSSLKSLEISSSSSTTSYANTNEKAPYNCGLQRLASICTTLYALLSFATLIPLVLAYTQTGFDIEESQATSFQTVNRVLNIFDTTLVAAFSVYTDFRFVFRSSECDGRLSEVMTRIKGNIYI
jgi:hypothetical protein